MITSATEGGYPLPEWTELGSAIRVSFYPHPLTQPSSPKPHTPSTFEKKQKILLALRKKPLPLRELLSQLDFETGERNLRNLLNQLSHIEQIRGFGSLNLNCADILGEH